MTKKNTRILIADRQHCRRLHIEKMLNQLGYYRIAPLNSFDEVMAVSRVSSPVLYLVIINIKDSLKHEEVKEYCKKNPLIRAVLYYNDDHSECNAGQQNLNAGAYSVSSNMPEIELIRQFMINAPHHTSTTLPRCSLAK